MLNSKNTKIRVWLKFAIKGKLKPKIINIVSITESIGFLIVFLTN